jgi:hypothetical protein
MHYNASMRNMPKLTPAGVPSNIEATPGTGLAGTTVGRAIFSLTKDPTLGAEWLKEFPEHKPGGSPVIYMPIGYGYQHDNVRARFAAARAAKQVAVFWWYPPTSVLKASGFKASEVVKHQDFLAGVKAVQEHVDAGGIAIGQLHGEFEQWAAVGVTGAEYKAAFEACRRLLPKKHCWVSWDKAPFVNGAAKGGPLNFVDWEPAVYDFVGMHPFSDALDENTSNGKDNRRFIQYMGKRKPWTMLEGRFTKGELQDPVQAEKYMTRLLAMWKELDVRVACAPLNENSGGDGGPVGWTSGRYVPGAHNPPGDKSSPAWPGSPKMCEMLRAALVVPGAFVQAGDPALAALAQS